MIDDTLPAPTAIDLALLESYLCRGIILLYSIANVTCSGGGVILAAKTICQKKVDGLAAPFSGCQACNDMCKAQRRESKLVHGQR